MSVSALSPTRFIGSFSGFLQVASVLALLLLLVKAVQFYLHRQWLLKALQQFPSPPFHWFFGHKVWRKGKDGWESREDGCLWDRSSNSQGKVWYLKSPSALWDAQLRLRHNILTIGLFKLWLLLNSVLIVSHFESFGWSYLVSSSSGWVPLISLLFSNNFSVIPCLVTYSYSPPSSELAWEYRHQRDGNLAPTGTWCSNGAHLGNYQAQEGFTLLGWVSGCPRLGEFSGWVNYKLKPQSHGTLKEKAREGPHMRVLMLDFSQGHLALLSPSTHPALQATWIQAHHHFLSGFSSRARYRCMKSPRKETI